MSLADCTRRVGRKRGALHMLLVPAAPGYGQPMAAAASQVPQAPARQYAYLQRL